MAKAKLVYDLNDHDDVVAHKRAVKSLDMAMALWDIVHNTKKSLEWQLEGKDKEGDAHDKYSTLELVYEKIYEILETHDINVDELIS